MNETIAYISNTLGGLYPQSEIRGFTSLLMEHICGIEPHELLMGKGRKLSATEKLTVNSALERLSRCEPVQYVTGHAYFYGLPFYLDNRVFIPRPETEELVDLIVRDYKGCKPKILDLGTGSGCIAVALAAALPGAEVTAVDISEDVFPVAGQNAAINNVNVSFLSADILSPSAGSGIEGMFDIIVSNPPYVTEGEKEEMEENVLLYEPSLAIFAPVDDPLAYYRAIARLSAVKLNEGGRLYFEINALLGKETSGVLASEGCMNIELITDLSGKDRIIRAER
ncbi:MAG: peptide chain release factor N(5)-glutamine methyltransferase [Tannerellaceae bacterium]|jgi:release factor glutamine methyltransferase|nr:peptide chain release factor N(5)-glutamine methyltransferase [Tannerellaceae bacterium]